MSLSICTCIHTHQKPENVWNLRGTRLSLFKYAEILVHVRQVCILTLCKQVLFLKSKIIYIYIYIYIFFKFWDHNCLAVHLKPIVGSRPYASDIGTDITNAAENSSKFEFKCIPCKGVYFADTFRYPVYSIDCSNKINLYCVVYSTLETLSWMSF